MSLVDLLQRLHKAGIVLRVSGEAIAYDAPAGAFTEALKREVVANKAELLEFLRHAETSMPERITPRPADKPTPLSFPQQRLWFLDQLEGPSGVYNMPLAVDIRGALDLEALQASLDALVRRHEALRTALVQDDGEAEQRVRPVSGLPLRMLDLSTLSPTLKEAELDRLRFEEAALPFLLHEGGLIRATLLRRGAEDYRLLLTLHHAIADGWSLGVLVQELGACYRGFASGALVPLPPLACQYGDFAYWQRHRAGTRIAAQLEYWRQRLAGLEPLLELPTDRPRPAQQRYDGDAIRIDLPKCLVDAARALAKTRGATLFMVLISVFNVLLARYTGTTDIAVGTSIANRRSAELEQLIGFFVNTLVVRLDLSGSPSFLRLLDTARGSILEAYEHQDAPFEQIVDVLQPVRDLSHSPLIQVMFDLQNLPARDLVWPGIEIEVLAPMRQTAKFDISFVLAETDEGMTGHIEYSTHLFDRETIERMRGHYRALLEALVSDPERAIDAVPMLTADEYRTIVRDWNDTARDYPGPRTLHLRFREQVARTPEAVAAVDARRRCTYRELDEASSRLARMLRDAGVGPRRLVGICAERSVEMLVGMLAALKAGAAYVPMDSAYPAERLSYMLQDSAVSVLMTQSWLCEKLTVVAGAAVILLDDIFDAPSRVEDLQVEVQSADWAYMMYTSGSTGAPKGALVTHAGALNHIDGELDVLGHSGAFNFLQSAPASSDISVWQFLAPLMTGGKTVILDDVTDAERMIELIRRESIDLVELVPVAIGLLMSHMRSLPEHARQLPSLRHLMATGETVAVTLVNDWLALYPSIPVVNAYGPTEAADDVTQEIVSQPLAADLRSVSIGRPLPNVRIYILDDGGQPQPVGVPGEICIGGICVGDGYWNKEALTEERFVPDFFVSGRLYRTGDLGRWHSDGRIEYIRRRDNQVKMRGFRIELGEIEAVLREYAGVTEAVAVVREDRPGDKWLVAYVTIDDAQVFSAVDIKQRLAARLPMHMVPTVIMRLDAFTLLPNGKLDRRSLPVPAANDADRGEIVPPSSPMQHALARIWRKILAQDDIGIHQSFFDLGGHSISATLVAAQVRREFGIELPLRDVFLHPTIAALADIVIERRLDGADSDELQALSARLDALSPEELEQLLLEHE